MFSSILSITLLLTTSSVLSQSIDNTAVANSIKSAAVSLDGEYYITNAETGETLSFTRDESTQTTNVFTDNNPQPVTLQTTSNSGLSGTIFSGCIGTQCKCLSSQWGFQQTGAGQSDNAAVSYACQVGSNDESSTNLHISKQFWQIIPVDGSSALSSSSPAPPAPSTPVVHTDKAGQENSYAGRKNVAATTSSSSSSSSEVDPKNRLTWPCRHPDWWLVRHPAYVTAEGHVECAARLAAASPSSYKFIKRSKSSPAHNARAFELLKRDATTLYHIISTDHLEDMETKAVGSKVISTPGNYKSQNLEPLDRNSKAQMWYISSTPPQ